MLDIFQIILKYVYMKTNRAAAIFEVLSSGIRLDVFRLLARHAPEGLVAGEIARRMDIPASNLSFHLKALMAVDMVSMEKEGRFLRYRANLPLMLETVAFLMEECCRNAPGTRERLHDESRAEHAALPKRRVW